MYLIIAGDGNKRIELEQMIERCVLQKRVQMLGAVPHQQIRNILVRGHIFLNTSLTEAFCIAIVEAASCGLLVVSTRVGGVPEVLPEHMIMFANTDPQDILLAIGRAIMVMKSGTFNPNKNHLEVSKMYSWQDVARRTDDVYHHVLTLPSVGLAERFYRYHGCGAFAGKFAVMIIATDHLLWCLLEFLFPRSQIDASPTFDQELFRKKLLKLREEL